MQGLVRMQFPLPSLLARFRLKQVEQRAIELARISDIGESKTSHVLARDTPDIARTHSMKRGDKFVGLPEVALVDRCSREEVGLIRVRFVLEEIVSNELTDELLETGRRQRLLLEAGDLGSHDSKDRVWIDRGYVHTPGRDGAFKDWRLWRVRQILLGTNLRTRQRRQ